MRNIDGVAIPETASPEALQAAAAVLAGHSGESSNDDVAAVLAREEFLRGRLRDARDREDIRRVNAGLFPRALPHLISLAYAGVCIEAGEAGGDYYDFFDCGPGRLRFAIGDVAGKGLASALLRATLRANLRTQALMGGGPLQESLALLNRLLFESMPQEMYCTLLLGEYDEPSRRVRYVNCGHPAPLLRSSHGFSALAPTATVLGLFSEWQGCMAEVELGLGDTLLLYTDGAIEATSGDGEEFGRDRLLGSLRVHGDLPLSSLLQACLDDIRRFAGPRQDDDLTLVALRGVEDDPREGKKI